MVRNKNIQIWDFVLACPDCNNKKRDKLAREDFLIKISERNEKMYESYEDKTGDVDTGKRIKMIYNWAQENGYNEIWTPKMVRE